MNSSTPICVCEGLSKENKIYIKRDDLLPFSFGGNKARIALEFFDDMEAKGKNCIIGYGNARSNLSRVLANMSVARNKKCHIISPSDDNGVSIETSNSKIVTECGAIVHKCSKQNVANTVERVIKTCEANGDKPYYIYGDIKGQGNKEVPVRAYVKVYDEIKSTYDYIFLATGTGMTHSGLLVGKYLYGGSENIVGISIARNAKSESNIIDEYIRAYFKSDGKKYVGNNDIIVDDSYISGGYGKYNDNIIKTVKMMMCLYGIPLDLTYTGKAFYGMLDYLNKNNIIGKKILFIHTGGTPLFFDNMSTIFQND